MYHRQSLQVRSPSRACNVVPATSPPDAAGRSRRRDEGSGTCSISRIRRLTSTRRSKGTLAQVVPLQRGGDSRTVPRRHDRARPPRARTHRPSPQPAAIWIPRSRSAASRQRSGALVAFLHSLTDDRVRCTAAPFDNPEAEDQQRRQDADVDADERGRHDRRRPRTTSALAAIGKNGSVRSARSISMLASSTQLPATMSRLEQ